MSSRAATRLVRSNTTMVITMAMRKAMITPSPSAGLCSQKKATDHSTPTTSWMKNQMIARPVVFVLAGRVCQTIHAATALSA